MSLGCGLRAGSEDAVVDQTIGNPLVQIGTQHQDNDHSKQHCRHDDAELKRRPPQMQEPEDGRPQGGTDDP
jgi:hypothetical protein